MEATSGARSALEEKRRDAAVQIVLEQREQRRQVEALVLGRNPSGRDRVEVIHEVDGDYVLKVYRYHYDSEVPTLPEAPWTTVVNGRADHTYYGSVELATLALLARRQNDNPNDVRYAVLYAARMLGIPTDW